MMNITIDMCSAVHLDALQPLFAAISQTILYLKAIDRDNLRKSFLPKDCRQFSGSLGRPFRGICGGETRGSRLLRSSRGIAQFSTWLWPLSTLVESAATKNRCRSRGHCCRRLLSGCNAPLSTLYSRTSLATCLPSMPLKVRGFN